jgi:hypothetical protein
MTHTKRHRTFRKKSHNKTRKSRKMRGGGIDEIRSKSDLSKSWADTKSWVVSGDDGIRYFVRVEKGETGPTNMDKELFITSKKDLETKFAKYLKDRKKYSIIPLQKK